MHMVHVWLLLVKTVFQERQHVGNLIETVVNYLSDLLVD